jgi:pilus assembly protein Flp/PilA
MQKLLRSAVRFLKCEDGPTAVEYAVMLALIIVVCLVAITALGTATSNKFRTVADAIDKAGGGTVVGS